MEGTEDDRHLYAVRCGETVEIVSHRVYPSHELLMLLTALKHRLHSHLLLCRKQIGLHPRRTASERIVEMPAQGGDSTTVELRYYLLTDAVERHLVEIDAIAQLDMSEIEAQQCRQIIAHALNIRARTVTKPSDTIHRVVVMAEHISALCLLLQISQQVLRALGTTSISQRVALLFTERHRHQCDN